VPPAFSEPDSLAADADAFRASVVTLLREDAAVTIAAVKRKLDAA
jgi:hypothetical protein